jgi:hypothetical protein
MQDFDDAQQEAILFPWVDTDEMSGQEGQEGQEEVDEDEEPDHGDPDDDYWFGRE